MAHMIPSTPKEFDPKSHEGDVFRALEKLSDDYYVFHSVTTLNITDDNTMYERESDFVVANRDKGVLTIEVKAGANIYYANGEWYYGSGHVMSHGGPYNQASGAKRNLMDCLQKNSKAAVRDIKKHCKFLSAVWFPDMPDKKLDELDSVLGGNRRITFSAVDMDDPTAKIEDIFKIQFPSQRYMAEEPHMTRQEFQDLLDFALCPTFKLIPTPELQHNLIDLRFNQLLQEQYRILDFLDEQPTAVINGAAGTGKTMIAVEKARRHSMAGERVLFLCYNHLLCDNLTRVHKENANTAYSAQFENVDFFTISKLTKRITGDFKDYQGLTEWLVACADGKKELGYKHIIVDEGQDFGLVDAELADAESSTGNENCSIIDWLQEAAVAENGTFYLFYDKYQMVQGGGHVEYALPDCIQNCDCRLTLHCNCRNTKEIAKTSVTPLKDKKSKAIKPTTACFWGEPAVPTMHIVQESTEIISVLNSVLDSFAAEHIDNAVILTVGIERYSALAEHISTNASEVYSIYKHNGKKYKVTTCIKFKGLEADAIVIVDLCKNSFMGQNGLNFYVGSSRAKYRLDMICQLSDDDCYEVVHALDPDAPDRRRKSERMRAMLGSLFSARISNE